MSQMGQNRKSSTRANVFRFAPESGHRAMQSACPFRAKGLNRSRGRALRHGRASNGWNDERVLPDDEGLEACLTRHQCCTGCSMALLQAEDVAMARTVNYYDLDP